MYRMILDQDSTVQDGMPFLSLAALVVDLEAATLFCKKISDFIEEEPSYRQENFNASLALSIYVTNVFYDIFSKISSQKQLEKTRPNKEVSKIVDSRNQSIHLHKKERTTYRLEKSRKIET